MGKKIYYSLSTSAILIFTVLILTISSNLKANNITDNLDPETLQWLQRVDSAGGNVSDSIIFAVDDYLKEIKGLKYQSLNIRENIFRENWFCGDFNAAFVPVIINSDGSAAALGNFTDSNRNFTPVNFTDTGKYSGIRGNGTDQFITTGFEPFSIPEFPLNESYFMIYSMTDSADAGRSGCRGSFGNGFYIYPKYLNGNSYSVLNSSIEAQSSYQSIKGYLLHQRTGNQIVRSYYLLDQINTSQNYSTSKPDKEIYICAFNNNGNVTSYSTTRYSGYSIGKSFSDQARIVHYNAVQRLMSKLGRELPGSVQPEITSKLMTFTGKDLTVNYRTRGSGSIRFGFKDINGNALSGYSTDDCIPLSGDEFSRKVSWSSGSDLSSLVNTPLYLTLEMSDADLFSIQFKEQIAQTDSTQPGFKIGAYKQFFADSLLIGTSLSVFRIMHNPVKESQPILSPEEDWEGDLIITTYSNVGYSKSIELEKMVYKMWLRVQNSYGRVPVYYESADGMNWTRPVLEQFKYNNSMENNIMSDAPYPGGLYTVVDDSLYNQSDSTKRYKSVYNTHPNPPNSILNVSFSYDGINWVPYSGNPVRSIGEDLSSCGWNPVLGKYLGYFRDSLAIRNIGRYVSDDWINWTYTGTILRPDGNDIPKTNYYNMNVLFKDSVYWGFLGHFQMNANADEDPPNPTRTDNTVFIELLFSRDGINFTRCGNRMPFLNYGELGEWDDQMVYAVGVPVIVGNEFYIYYNGFNFKHMWNPLPPADGGPKKSHIGLAKIGIDRFVSLSSY
ncbi:MAG: hypothetical protein IPM38_02570 [Ignavibacteria bacterium]|nr:hypothetical protein [Ignavibacteria bacterium]